MIKPGEGIFERSSLNVRQLSHLRKEDPRVRAYRTVCNRDSISFLLQLNLFFVMGL